MRNLRMLYAEPFTGLEQLVEKLQDATVYARVNGHGTPAVETRVASTGAVITLYEETLSDNSTQLLAVVRA